MKLRTFLLEDLEEVAMMFKELVNVIYPKHKKGQDEAFLQAVKYWIISKKDIFVVEHEGKPIAFSLSWVEDWKIIEKFYNGELLYVKPSFRNSKASYLLYANMLKIAFKSNLPIHAKGYINNNASKILSKFGEPYFIEFIKV